MSDGQRRHDLTIAIENVAGDLEDLQAGGRLAEGIDPISTALAIETTYQRLWTELTGTDEFDVNETFRIDIAFSDCTTSASMQQSSSCTPRRTDRSSGSSRESSSTASTGSD